MRLLPFARTHIAEIKRIKICLCTTPGTLIKRLVLRPHRIEIDLCLYILKRI